jgi:hypothetical protein
MMVVVNVRCECVINLLGVLTFASCMLHGFSDIKFSFATF